MKSFPFLSLLVVGILVSYTVAVQRTPTRAHAQIPMRMEIQLDQETCVFHQNFSFTVRIVNPNDYDVTLPGFVFGYIEPEIYLLRDEPDPIRLYQGAMDSARGGPPIRIRAGGVLERARFIWRDTFSCRHWPNQPGVVRLRAGTHVLNSARIDGVDEPRPIDWELPVVELRVRTPGLLDRRAWAWLAPWLSNDFCGSNDAENCPPNRITERRLRVYADFLDRFPDSTYAPAIRWETLRLVAREIVDQWSPLYDDPQMIRLWQSCLVSAHDSHY